MTVKNIFLNKVGSSAFTQRGIYTLREKIFDGNEKSLYLASGFVFGDYNLILLQKSCATVVIDETKPEQTRNCLAEIIKEFGDIDLGIIQSYDSYLAEKCEKYIKDLPTKKRR